jgi:hypothetical protein
MLFLERKYRDAVAEYARTLAIDPEDLEAHYNLMLCYRGLGDDAQAEREEKLYMRFKANEAAQAITGAFKLAHPDDNNEAQPIHEHVSVALNGKPGTAYPRESPKPMVGGGEPVARNEHREPEIPGARTSRLPVRRNGGGDHAGRSRAGARPAPTG